MKSAKTLSRADEVLAILHDRGPSMARHIAERVDWASHGSSRELNDELQALRRMNRIRYIKGLGWAVVP